jgi:hypothetical protein
VEPVVAKFAAVFHPPRSNLADLHQLFGLIFLLIVVVVWYYIVAKKANCVYVSYHSYVLLVSVFYFNWSFWGTLPCGSHLLTTWAQSVGKCKAKSCINLASRDFGSYRTFVKYLRRNVGRRMSSLVKIMISVNIVFSAVHFPILVIYSL